MVTIVKSEWHQVERRYGLDIDEDILQQIYPDFTDQEIQEVLDEIASGEITPETLLEDAENNGVPLDFDWLDEDDWWTDRKGGYEVTYEVTESEPETASEDGDEWDPAAELDKITIDPELSCHNCPWEGYREQAVVEDDLLMCPECNKPVGHFYDAPQVEASWDDLRNQLSEMMKKNV